MPVGKPQVEKAGPSVELFPCKLSVSALAVHHFGKTVVRLRQA